MIFNLLCRTVSDHLLLIYLVDTDITGLWLYGSYFMSVACNALCYKKGQFLLHLLTVIVLIDRLH